MKHILWASVAAALFTHGMAHAETVNGSDLLSSVGNTTATVNGVTFEANNGTFAEKSVAGYTNIGLNGGRTAGEINIGQSIQASWMGHQQVSAFTVALLFNGPEYHDVNETAKITLTGDTGIYGKLIAVEDTIATWQVFDASGHAISGVTNITSTSPATEGQAAVWTVTNPFGSATGTGVNFAALPGVCTTTAYECDESDYAFNSLTISAVPEPSSYALFGAGLLAVGSLVLRRRNQHFGN